MAQARRGNLLYTSPMVTARDMHLHFKHITHRRVGTYNRNRFPDRANTCRICGETDESSTHLGECPGTTSILGELNKVARFSPKIGRSREETIIDNLFVIYPKGDAPKVIYVLYLLAWRYIITDFYRIHYDGINFSEETILIRIIERYTTP